MMIVVFISQCVAAQTPLTMIGSQIMSQHKKKKSNHSAVLRVLLGLLLANCDQPLLLAC
jgi:hypothetical protein